MGAKLYHMGFRGGVSRNNLANANRQRDWQIYADFARVLIAQARALYQNEPLGLELDQTVYAFDSTTIDLCLSLFPWAQFRRHKSAVKLHTLLDLRGRIPTAIYVTGGAGKRCEACSTNWSGGSGSLLSPRPRLYRLSPTVSHHPSAGFLRYPRRSEH